MDLRAYSIDLLRRDLNFTIRIRPGARRNVYVDKNISVPGQCLA